jgi:hypothetical protein
MLEVKDRKVPLVRKDLRDRKAKLDLSERMALRASAGARAKPVSLARPVNRGSRGR